MDEFSDKGSFITSPDYQGLCEGLGIQKQTICSPYPPRMPPSGVGVQVSSHGTEWFIAIEVLRAGGCTSCSGWRGKHSRRGFGWEAVTVADWYSLYRLEGLALTRWSALCCDSRGLRYPEHLSSGLPHGYRFWPQLLSSVLKMGGTLPEHDSPWLDSQHAVGFRRAGNPNRWKCGRFPRKLLRSRVGSLHSIAVFSFWVNI